MQTLTKSAPSATPAALGGKYLTFHIGAGTYGIQVIQVREIMRMQPITSVPQMPEYIKGVLNLRGKIIPVVDLRVKFGMSEIRQDEHTCIIVVQIQVEGTAMRQMGVIVDGVEEVANISAADIEETPHFGQNFDTEHLMGMAKVRGTVITLLDTNKVVEGDLIKQFEATK